MTNTLLSIILAVLLFLIKKFHKNYDKSSKFQDTTSGKYLSTQQADANSRKSQRLINERLICSAAKYFANCFIASPSKNSNFSWRKRKKRKKNRSRLRCYLDSVIMYKFMMEKENRKPSHQQNRGKKLFGFFSAGKHKSNGNKSKDQTRSSFFESRARNEAKLMPLKGKEFLGIDTTNKTPPGGTVETGIIKDQQTAANKSVSNSTSARNNRHSQRKILIQLIIAIGIGVAYWCGKTIMGPDQRSISESMDRLQERTTETTETRTLAEATKHRKQLGDRDNCYCETMPSHQRLNYSIRVDNKSRTTEEQRGPTSSKCNTVNWIYTPYRLNPSCLGHSDLSLIFAHLLPVTFTHLLFPGSLGGLSPCVRSTPTADLLRLGNGVQQFRLETIEISSRGVNGEWYTVCDTYSSEETENGVQLQNTIIKEVGRRNANSFDALLYKEEHPDEPIPTLQGRRCNGKDNGNHYRPNQYDTSDGVLEVNATKIGSLLITRTPAQRYPGTRLNTTTMSDTSNKHNQDVNATTPRRPRRGSSGKQLHNARHNNHFQWSQHGERILTTIAKKAHTNQYDTSEVVLQVNTTEIGRNPQRIMAVRQTDFRRWNRKRFTIGIECDTAKRRTHNDAARGRTSASERSRIRGRVAFLTHHQRARARVTHCSPDQQSEMLTRVTQNWLVTRENKPELWQYDHSTRKALLCRVAGTSDSKDYKINNYSHTSVLHK